MKIDPLKIEEAAKNSEGKIRHTPLLRSEAFEKHLGLKHPIFFKPENLQHTGSFKVRGSLNKILSILPSAKSKGVITASAGNHAQGVAYHCFHFGIKATIVMPERTPIVKQRATRAWGAEVVLKGESYQEAFNYALELQKKSSAEFVHAFEDQLVIEGQGTLGFEVFLDCPEIETFVCPIGGGGLLAGSGSYLKSKNPRIKVIAVQAEGCSTFLASIKAGKPVTLEKVDTIAEGISAKRMGDMTFDICRELVDETVIVNDSEISQGLLWVLENERLFVEGCAGATIAAIIKRPEIISGPTVIVLSGGNLDVNLLARIIERGLVKDGRRVRFEATLADVPGSLERFIHVLAEEKASILEIDHERVFSQASLREVSTYVQLETEGPEHVGQIKSRLNKGPWPIRFM